jgi:hypothetical protein
MSTAHNTRNVDLMEKGFIRTTGDDAIASIAPPGTRSQRASDTTTLGVVQQSQRGESGVTAYDK